MDEISDIAETAPPPTARLSAEAITLAALLAEFAARPLGISDDLPRYPAINHSELDAIERYMGDILDEVLGHHAAESSETSKHIIKE